MRKVVLAIMIAALLCSGINSCASNSNGKAESSALTTAEKAEKANKINVMSFNALNSKNAMIYSVLNSEAMKADGSISVRGPKLNAMLIGENIDVAGLQELDTGWRDWLESNLDARYQFVGGYTSNTSEAGYILYNSERYTVLQSGVFWLSPGGSTKPTIGWDARFDRICSYALFQINESGSYFLFFSTHLDHEGETARTESASLIVSQIESLCAQVVAMFDIETCPAILVGDMNSVPSEDPYKIYTGLLRDALVYSTGSKVSPSYSTSPGYNYLAEGADYIKDGHRIDYIFVSNEITVNNYKMIHTSTNRCEYGSFISDHNALVAHIAFD